LTHDGQAGAGIAAGWQASLRGRVPSILLRPLAGQAGVTVLGQVAATLVGLLTNLLSARVLGPGAFGTAALLLSFPAIVWSIAGVKSLTVTTRYLASFRATGRDDEFRGICKLGYLVDLAVAVVAFAVIAATGWWVVPRLLGLHGAGWVLVLYAASYPFYSLVGTSTAVFTTWGRFGALAALQLAQKVLILAFTGGLLWAGRGWPAIVLGTAAGQALYGLLMLALTARLLRSEGVGAWWSARMGAVASLRREIASFFGWNYLYVTSGGMLQQAPLMLLGRLAGVEAAGYYRLALSLVIAASYLETALARVTYPLLAARWETHDRGSTRANLRRWSLRAGAPAAAVLLLGIPVLPFAISVLLDARYAPMVPGAQLMLVGAAVSAAFFWLQPFYYSAGYVSDWVKGSIGWMLAVVAGGWVAVSAWGYLGMSAVSALGEVGLTLSMVYVLHRRAARLWDAAPGPAPPGG
jgi:O-antigen/teichoic acid export membrane protein